MNYVYFIVFFVVVVWSYCRYSHFDDTPIGTCTPPMPFHLSKSSLPLDLFLPRDEFII
jgi:hypothetical protein